ncbi:MAG: RpiB/LacA/LacB family sugar-phosphate isomerase [Parcubacteria group bacterium]|nr:RpiB/LacA/LacB family sugar-phosphate isomerase [Parcubacteria group bacterium]
MKVYFGADHRGFHLKEKLKAFLSGKGYEVIDLGNDRLEPGDDYTAFALKVANAVAEHPREDRGILLCGSGVGVDITANKIDGIRSALVADEARARTSRTDDDTNVLALPADTIEEALAERIAVAWLTTPFSGTERHQRRLKDIEEIEKHN